MMVFRRILSFATVEMLLMLASSAIPALAQQPPPPVFTEVHPDRRITFRLRAPRAQEVSVAVDSVREPLPMQKDAQGVWSVTTGPFEPNYYGYAFTVDGGRVIDPTNPLLQPNLLSTESMLLVPGAGEISWQASDVPHGVIHHHFYHSQVVGDDRDFYVYTPPGYDPRGQTRYPVLYLLPGYSDAADAWTAVGRAHTILDNLIAQGKAKPMLIVMPLGYGAPEIVQPTPVFAAAFHDLKLRQHNFDRFRDALLQEVIPAVESSYRVASERKSRAIAGLSMGGTETLLVGLNHLDRFAWVGAFSSGGLGEDFAQQFPGLDSKANSQLRLLWVSCGKDDSLIGLNRKLHDWLGSRQIKLQWHETDGSHTWQVWRRNLTNLAQLLFR